MGLSKHFIKISKCVSNTHIGKCGGAVKIVCLSLVYSELLKLTAACLWVTRDYQRISGQSRMITIWMTDLAYHTWADDDVGAVNDVHSWIARPLFKPMLRPIWRNLASYRFRDIRGQNLGSCGPLGVALNQWETVSWTHICRHVKFHADRCQCRRDICNRTDRHKDSITADLIADKTHTSVALVSNNNMTV